MAYVRFSSKVVDPCPTCKDEGWESPVPGYPDMKVWRGHMEGGKREPMPRCCTSCWYIWLGESGLQVMHANRGCVEFEDVILGSVEEAQAWDAPRDCRHREVAMAAVREWIEEETGWEYPSSTARWHYEGEWREFEVDLARGHNFEVLKKYRVRTAVADNGAWREEIVQQETRNGWGNVGKKVSEGIEIGRSLQRIEP